MHFASDKRKKLTRVFLNVRQFPFLGRVGLTQQSLAAARARAAPFGTVHALHQMCIEFSPPPSSVRPYFLPPFLSPSLPPSQQGLHPSPLSPPIVFRMPWANSELSEWDEGESKSRQGGGGGGENSHETLLCSWDWHLCVLVLARFSWALRYAATQRGRGPRPRPILHHRRPHRGEEASSTLEHSININTERLGLTEEGVILSGRDFMMHHRRSKTTFS